MLAQIDVHFSQSYLYILVLYESKIEQFLSVQLDFVYFVARTLQEYKCCRQLPCAKGLLICIHRA